MKASEKAKAARSARGRKEGSRLFLASMRASLPTTSSLGLFRQKMGGVQLPLLPFLKEKP